MTISYTFVDRALDHLAKTAKSVARRAKWASHNRRLARFERASLFDARLWRGGWAGPPFGKFRNARLGWCPQMLDEANGRGVEGVILDRRQVSWLVRDAEERTEQHPPTVSPQTPEGDSDD